MLRRTATDRRDLPAYPLPEAALYLRVPVSTLRHWVGGPQAIVPVPARQGRRVLSFFDMTECHVLAAIRRVHDVPMQRVRRALKYVRGEMSVERPLLQQQFLTDGAALFVEHMGDLIDASAGGQAAFRAAIEASLRRIDRGADGLPIRLRPFVAGVRDGSPDPVVIDPAVSFGRPVVKGSGVPTAVLASRVRAGEPATEIANDVGLSVDEVAFALACESREVG